MPNYSDPNLNFDLETATLIDALKQAKGNRDARFEIGGPGLVRGQHGMYFVGDGGASAVETGLRNIRGGFEAPRIEQQQRDLATEEQRRVNALQKELLTPGTKQVEQMGPTEDGSALPNIAQPLSPEEESRRRLGIYSGLSRLPSARKLAEAGIKSEIDFPEKNALQEAKLKHTMELLGVKNESAMKELELKLDNAIRLKEIPAQSISHNYSYRYGDGGDGSGSPKLQQKGYTPEGQPVSFNPATGQQYVEGKPYVGDVIGGSDFSKGGAARISAERAVAKADQMIADVEKNPQAFGVIPAAATLLPNAAASRIQAKVLTPEQLQTRMAVGQQAGQIINEIYGAALSMGEAARANSWAWNPNDNFETTLSKLKQARAWQAQNAAKMPKPGGSPAPAAGGVVDFSALPK